METATHPQLTELVLIKPNIYQVRENITVFIAQRSKLTSGKIDEAQAVFDRKGDTREHEVVLNLPELQQIASICGYPQPNPVIWNTRFNELDNKRQPRFAPEAPIKDYKMRDCGLKLNLEVYDNQRLDLEYKFYKGEKYSRMTLEIEDILAVLALIKIEEVA